MNMNQQSSGAQWETHQNLLSSISPIVDGGIHYLDVICRMTQAKPIRVSGVKERCRCKPQARSTSKLMAARFIGATFSSVKLAAMRPTIFSTIEQTAVSSRYSTAPVSATGKVPPTNTKSLTVPFKVRKTVSYLPTDNMTTSPGVWNLSFQAAATTASRFAPQVQEIRPTPACASYRFSIAQPRNPKTSMHASTTAGFHGNCSPKRTKKRGI